MAVLSNVSSQSSILAGLNRAFDGVVNFMVSISEAQSRVKQVEALNAKSDAELAEMGVKREDIVQRVFRDAYYV